MIYLRRLSLLPFLIGLLIADGLFFVGHLLYVLDYLDNPRFLVNFDAGFAERFQYAKALTSGALLIFAARNHRAPLFAFLGFSCLYLFLDDSLRIHERVGGLVLGETLLFDHLANGYHLGQLVFACILALLIFGPIALLWRRADRFTRLVSVGLLSFFVLLGFASVGIDLLHGVFTPDALESLAILFEEGGEHLAFSLILWWSAWLVFQGETLGRYMNDITATGPLLKLGRNK